MRKKKRAQVFNTSQMTSTCLRKVSLRCNDVINEVVLLT